MRGKDEGKHGEGLATKGLLQEVFMKSRRQHDWCYPGFMPTNGAGDEKVAG